MVLLMVGRALVSVAASDEMWTLWNQDLTIKRPWHAMGEVPTAEECAKGAHAIYVGTVHIATALGSPGQRSTAQFLCLPKGLHPDVESEWSGQKAK